MKEVGAAFGRKQRSGEVMPWKVPRQDLKGVSTYVFVCDSNMEAFLETPSLLWIPPLVAQEHKEFHVSRVGCQSRASLVVVAGMMFEAMSFVDHSEKPMHVSKFISPSSLRPSSYEERAFGTSLLVLRTGRGLDGDTRFSRWHLSSTNLLAV